jgi:hypothetical protein
VIFCLGLWFCLSFLPHQEIWVDETTQLSGLTLSPTEVVPWLSGVVHHDFGVPPDRMPPVSYWAGWGWSQIFGLSEHSMRMLGVTAIALTALLLAATARIAWGAGADVLAMGVFFFSPNTLVASVEIRAYPLFLLTTAGTLYFAVRLSDFSSKKPASPLLWPGLACCWIAGIYTHFYGLVVSGAVICGMAMTSFQRPELRKPLLIWTGAMAVTAVGLLPFVHGATDMGSSGGEGVSISGCAKYFYRALIGHPALGALPGVIFLGMVCFLLMLMVSLMPRRIGQGSCRMLLIVLVAGAVVVFVAKILIGKFDALSPSYNLWRLPVLSLLAGSVVAIHSPGWRKTAITAACGVIVAGVLGCFSIHRHPEVFRHTPPRELLSLIKSHAPAALVYESNGPWGHIYYPLIYSEGSWIRNYLLKKDEKGQDTVLELPNLQKIPVTALPDRIMLIAVVPQDANHSVLMCHGNLPQQPIADNAERLHAGGYEKSYSGFLPAQEGVRFEIYQRASSHIPLKQ